MPQPASVEALAAALAAVYAGAWERIEEAQEQLLQEWPSLSQSARAARLRALRDLVATLRATVDEQALRFAADDLPAAYLTGVLASSGVTRGVSFDALAVLARDTYSDLLASTAHVSRTTKDLVRVLTRQHIADKLVRGDTAVQAGRDLAHSLDAHRISAITYADGSRHGLAEYAQVVARTKTAVAYSTGTLDGAAAAGALYVEVFDGPSCGWTSHDSADKAGGTIRSIEDARAHPISHPNCQRAFGARPEIRTRAQAEAARPSSTPEQFVDQGRVEQARELAVARRAARKALSQRASRDAERLLADPANRVKSPSYSRRIAARNARLDRPARAQAHADRLAARAGRPDATARDVAKHLRAQATAAEPELTALTSRLVTEHGGEMAALDSRLKALPRLVQKITKDMRDDGRSAAEVGATIFDVNRYTGVFPERQYAAGAQAVLDALRDEGHGLRVKNFWGDADYPYQGINVGVTTPDGQRFELQFHTPKSFEVSKRDHQIYELQRVEMDRAQRDRYTEQLWEGSAEIPVPRGASEVR